MTLDISPCVSNLAEREPPDRYGERMPSDTKPITYREFAAWYEQWRPLVLEPGLDEAIHHLEQLLEQSLSERDRMRIHRVSGRVKSRQRAWRKLRLSVDDPVTDTADVPDAVHDLIGVRVTCTNLRDIEMVQEALEALPAIGSPSTGGLSIDRGAERDYTLEPKESGYRGWHVGLGLAIESPEIADAKNGRVAVGCELQVRTLLQDTWGELTHVDAYSKDGALPPLVAVLGSRMADLLATLDDIAEDLRTELDRVDDEAVARDVEPSGDNAATAEVDEQAEEATAALVDRWMALDRPVDLATLAWEARQRFGPEVSDTWFGHGSFKRFVLHALPDAEISGGRQQFLLPQEVDAAPEETPPSPPADEPADAASTTAAVVPESARRLREIDKGLPLLPDHRWPALFGHLEAVLDRWDTSVPPARAINRVTRAARDRSRSAGEALPRRHFDYVLKALLASEEAAADHVRQRGAEQLRDEFTRVTLDRMTELRLLGERNRKGRRAVRDWISGGTDAFG